MAAETLHQINQLASEWTMINRAMQLFDLGARISSMTLSTTPDPGIPGQLPQIGTVSTEYMNYPQPMVETIKGMLVQRKQQIETELAQLGVSL